MGIRSLVIVWLILSAAGSLLAAGPILSGPRLVTNQFQFRLSGNTSDAYIIEGSADLKTWEPVVTNFPGQSVHDLLVPVTNSMRAYRAKVGTPLGGFGILAQTAFVPNGHEVYSDSFNSADPTASTLGYYDPAKRRDRGNIGTYVGFTNLGIVQIAGTLYTGPNRSVQLGARGSIGEAVWIDSGRTGIEPGYLSTNFPPELPAAPPPPSGGFSAFPPGGMINGEFYDWILPTGVYVVNEFTMSGGQQMWIEGDVIIHVRGDLTTSGTIRLSPGNTRLTLFLGGNAQLGGQGVVGGVTADQFVLLGLPTAASINVAFNSTFVGVIYAPNSTCRLGSGGGKSSFVGSLIASSVVLQGAVDVHFDENLKYAHGFY